MLDRIRDGRTDLVADYVAAHHAASSADPDGRQPMERSPLGRPR